MKISVSESLAHTGLEVARPNHSYDVSVILQKDLQTWMERTSRRMNLHIVQSVSEGEQIVKLYKEFSNGVSSTSSH
jgi:hypothetical protein